MTVRDSILNRRSVRKYTGETLSEDSLRRILEAGLLAPSSQNRKPCEFYLVRDKDQLKELASAKKLGSAFLKECAAAVVVAADSEKADTWIEDASIALSYMNLAATEEQIASCWCQIHLRQSADGTDAEEKVREQLHLPQKERIVGVLALGIAARNAKPHSPEEADFSRVHDLQLHG